MSQSFSLQVKLLTNSSCQVGQYNSNHKTLQDVAQLPLDKNSPQAYLM